MYLSASNLSSTNITIGNYSFLSGNASPSGTFPNITKLLQNPVTQLYEVPLNYSQVAYCRTRSDTSGYYNFPRYNSLW